MGVESEGTSTRRGGEGGEGGEDKRPRGSGRLYFN
jgi:hypothetical protein